MKLRNCVTHDQSKSGKNLFFGVLCICFVAGFLLGGLLYRGIGSDSNLVLSAYLREYAAQLESDSDVSLSFLQVCFVYLRYPVILYLLAFSTAGIYLIPALCFMQGISLSFALSCFSGELGRLGVQLAFFTFGIRCLFVLPCCLYLGSISARRFTGKRSKHSIEKRGISRNGVILYPALFCLSFLFVGILIEITFVPKLFFGLLTNIL